jgi:hypothetical protein
MRPTTLAGNRSDAPATNIQASSPAPARDYVMCGWRVRSELSLPEAAPWTGDDRSADITIRFGPAPNVASPIREGRPGVAQIGRNGDCCLEVPGVARYFVTEGRHVTVEPQGDPDGLLLRAWLLGSVLGILCHQRGLFPLHASCVRIGGYAVALTGRPGAGKSTLAAALVQRGHGLVCDDVCVIDVAGSDRPMVLPSFPRLKLWEDAMERLAIPREGVPRGNPDLPKFHFCQPGRFDPSPVELGAIYSLDRNLPGQGDDIRPGRGADAAHALATEIFRPGVGFRVGTKPALLTTAMRIASAVPIMRAPVRSKETPIAATAARIEADFLSRCRNAAAIASAAR